VRRGHRSHEGALRLELARRTRARVGSLAERLAVSVRMKRCGSCWKHQSGNKISQRYAQPYQQNPFTHCD
jgi:hypothetical protein